MFHAKIKTLQQDCVSSYIKGRGTVKSSYQQQTVDLDLLPQQILYHKINGCEHRKQRERNCKERKSGNWEILV